MGGTTASKPPFCAPPATQYVTYSGAAMAKSRSEILEEAGLIDPDAALNDALHPPADAYDDVDLGPNKGGRKKGKKGLIWEVVRVLKAPDDIHLLHDTLPAARANLTQIRHSHHQLARILSEGKSHTDASQITGYSPAYISVLKTDPSFSELISYYAAQQEMQHVDVLDRMRVLGLNTLEELQTRLETDPDSYSLRELMEQAELMLIKPMAATRSTMPIASGGVGNHGVQVNVNFVKSDSNTSPLPAPNPNTITIEHE